MLSLSSFAEIAHGTCGDKLTWTLSDDYTLIIDGEGKMNNWTINSYAPWFSYRSQIRKLSIGERVTSIGDYAFSDCSGLTSVTIPNSVTSIGNDAFSYCSGLTSVTIPNSVTSIGDYAFYYCSSLTSVTIPNSVTSIGEWAFRDCSGLTSVTIGNSVTSIGNLAFYGCSGLTSVTIPNSVTSIGYYAFRDCSRLREVHSNNITPPDCGQDTFQGVQTANCRLYVPTGTKEDYALAPVWGNFVNIIEEAVVNPTDDIEVPTISYDNNKLIFDCGTPDVTYSYTIKAEDSTSSLTDSENGEIELSATYVITAYAKKDNKTSEPATATLHWMTGTMDIATGSQEFDAKRAIVVSSSDGFVNVSGLSDGEKVEVYSTDGKLLNTVYAAGNAANIAAKVGDTIILKINGETIKVLVK